MRRLPRLARLAMFSLLAVSGCWRADVYPVIRGTPDASGAGDTGDAGSVATTADTVDTPDTVDTVDAADAADAASDPRGTVDATGPKETNDSIVCPASVLPAGDSTVTIQVGAVSRSYVLHIPANYDGKKPAPLLVDFHGIGSSGWGEWSNSPYPPVTDAEGVVMAFPDGMKGPIGTGWNMGPCCVADVDDLGFARALVANVGKTACIDPRRVYAVGVLTGGGMVNALACRAADIFAAVAPAAFDLLQETVAECKPVRPITVVSFRGTADPRVPYAGGPSSLVPGMPITFLGAENTFKMWAQINRCPGSPSGADNKNCRSYTGCDGGSEVVLCTKQGGGDAPGDPSVAWPILKRHSL